MEQMHPERDGHAQPQHRHEQTGRQNILNFFLAFIAIAWAVVFGVFSILSWRSAEKANEQAELANLIALADMCGGSVQDGTLKDLCNAASSPILSSLAAKVTATFLPQPTEPQGTTIGTGAIIAIAVTLGTLTGLVGLGTMCLPFPWRHRRR